MDLNHVAVFVRVVETGSFSAAATALGLRRSSVSRNVAALEDALGIRLLQRTTRRLALTDAGRAYHDRAKDALAALGEARESVAALGAAPRGLVRVTAPLDLADGLAAATGPFLAAHPGVRVDVLLTARVVDIVAEGVDLAIRAGALKDSSLVARRLGAIEYGLFASPRYLEGAGRPRRLSEVAHHACVLYRAGGATATWRMDGPRGPEQVTVRGRVDCDDLAFVRAMLLADGGIGWAPTYMFDPLVQSGALERVLPRLSLGHSAVHVVWPSRRFEAAAVVAYRAAIEATLPRVFEVGSPSSRARSPTGSARSTKSTK